ncbi:flavodoxin domain-containing protein [Streptomyces kaempferi]
MLQKFKFADTSDYKMDVKEALTRKPGGFELKVRARQEHERTVFGAVDLQRDDTREQAAVSGVGVNLTVAYGSSLGSCEDLARTIADRGERSGFGTTLVGLDELGDNLPTEGLLVVVASSYNGKAPDNAQRFDDLLAAACRRARCPTCGLRCWAPATPSGWPPTRASPSGSRQACWPPRHPRHRARHRGRRR